MIGVAAMAARAGAIALPWWVKWAALTAVVAAVYAVGRLHEARRGQGVHNDYITKQAARTIVITKQQVAAAVRTEIRYRDRVKEIYVQGEKIEREIPQLVTPADAERFGVNAGFVRVLDAAWSGDAVGPATDSDREPSAIPLDGIAGAQAENATSCRVWREKVFAWRDFYAKQQQAVNGVAGSWEKVNPVRATEIDE